MLAIFCSAAWRSANTKQRTRSSMQPIAKIVLPGLLAFGFAFYIWWHAGTPDFNHGPEWDSTVAAIRSIPRARIYEAMDAFERDNSTSRTEIPPTVLLDDLVARGYLHPHEVHLLTNMYVWVSTGLNPKKRPHQVILSVHLPNGRIAGEAANGEISLQAKAPNRSTQ